MAHHPVSIRRRFGACLFVIFVAGATSAPAIEVRAPEVGAPSPAPAPTPQAEAVLPLPPAPQADPTKVALGESLFADPQLSADGTRACTTCHDIKTNGAGHYRFDTGTDGQPLRFNTLTVFNAALNFRFGWLGKTRTLEAQAEASLNDQRTMGTDVEQVVARLRGSSEINKRFKAVFGHRVDRTSLLDALATYERTLLTPGSRFDRWLQGENDALSPAEQEGYRLFRSLGCISCHQGVNIGGNLLEHPGVFAPLTTRAPGLVRVPSLRNVAVTAPYFHDGSAATLPEAIRKMAAAQLDQSLSDQQVAAIVAFLGSLTGIYRDVPVTAEPPP
jgi:cytochrome c peroxidase